jgi:hypothetical protein
MCWVEQILFQGQYIFCQVCQIFDTVTRTCT